MTITTLRELFIHDLEDIYYAENELLDALESLADQTEDEEIAEAFREHREETRGHVGRLERVFEMFDEEPQREECEGIDGLIEEHRDFLDEEPEPALADLHNLVAGQKTEHYEIAAYGNLALIADRLGQDEAGDLLHENLEEEKAALDTLASLTDDFGYERVREAASPS